MATFKGGGGGRLHLWRNGGGVQGSDLRLILGGGYSVPKAREFDTALFEKGLAPDGWVHQGQQVGHWQAPKQIWGWRWAWLVETRGWSWDGYGWGGVSQSDRNRLEAWGEGGGHKQCGMLFLMSVSTGSMCLFLRSMSIWSMCLFFLKVSVNRINVSVFKVSDNRINASVFKVSVRSVSIGSVCLGSPDRTAAGWI